MKILITDDELEIRKVLTILMEKRGHRVVCAKSGEEAVEIMSGDSAFDLCIMDIMMPNLNGIEAVKRIRNFSDVPVLFLTAKSLDSDKEAAYLAGGDDYIVKPFSSGELLMKVDALTRRYNMYSGKADSNDDVQRITNGVSINIEAREVYRAGETLDISDKELDMLIYLFKNRGRAVSVDEIYTAVWEQMALPSSANTVTVHMLSLRKKLEENPSSPKIIRTIWGKGYQID